MKVTLIKERMEDNEIYIILFNRSKSKLSKGKKCIRVLVISITNATTQPLK